VSPDNAQATLLRKLSNVARQNLFKLSNVRLPNIQKVLPQILEVNFNQFGLTPVAIRKQLRRTEHVTPPFDQLAAGWIDAFFLASKRSSSRHFVTKPVDETSSLLSSLNFFS
jgi:hypothetical protein